MYTSSLELWSFGLAQWLAAAWCYLIVQLSNEPYEHLHWLCHDNGIVNIVLSIILLLLLLLLSSYYYRYYYYYYFLLLLLLAEWLMQEEALEESGWKLVHGDVFRPPIYRRLLVALTGAGIQIFMSTFIVIGNISHVRQ